MQPTRLVLIEGIPGAGKSTTARFVKDVLARRGLQPQFYTEGDLDHPADYESVACLSLADYEHLLAAYPAWQETLSAAAIHKNGDVFIGYRKLQEQPGNWLPDNRLPSNQSPNNLFQALARFEVYELPAGRFMRVVGAHWQEFTGRAANQSQPYIFECCFWQNPLTTLLARHNLSPEAAMEFIRQLTRVVAPLNPMLIYLEPTSIRSTLEAAAQSRPKEWLDYVTGYITGQEWGRVYGQSGFDGMVRFYEMRRDIEKQLFEDLAWPKLWIDQAGQDWPAAYERIERLF